jgi:acetyl-CoA synthetase
MYRQTETGSIVVTPFPGAIETKPGSATVPFFGIEPAILDATTGVVRTPESSSLPTFSNRMQELKGDNVEGVLALRNPWPSIARTIWGDHKRYLETYMAPYPGMFYTGDGAARDEHGYIWIKGRVDGVFVSPSLFHGILIVERG